MGNLVGFKSRALSTSDIFIQLGATLAVEALCRQRFTSIVSTSKTGFAGSKTLTLLLITTLRAGIAGFVPHHLIIQYLFNSVSVSIGLTIGEIGLLFVEKFLPKIKKSQADYLDWRDS